MVQPLKVILGHSFCNQSQGDKGQHMAILLYWPTFLSPIVQVYLYSNFAVASKRRIFSATDCVLAVQGRSGSLLTLYLKFPKIKQPLRLPKIAVVYNRLLRHMSRALTTFSMKVETSFVAGFRVGSAGFASMSVAKKLTIRHAASTNDFITKINQIRQAYDTAALCIAHQ